MQYDPAPNFPLNPPLGFCDIGAQRSNNGIRIIVWANGAINWKRCMYIRTCANTHKEKRRDAQHSRWNVWHLSCISLRLFFSVESLLLNAWVQLAPKSQVTRAMFSFAPIYYKVPWYTLVHCSNESQNRRSPVPH